LMMFDRSLSSSKRFLVVRKEDTSFLVSNCLQYIGKVRACSLIMTVGNALLLSHAWNACRLDVKEEDQHHFQKIMLFLILAISFLHVLGMLVRLAKRKRYLAKNWSSFKRASTVGGIPRDSDFRR